MSFPMWHVFRRILRQAAERKWNKTAKTTELHWWHYSFSRLSNRSREITLTVAVYSLITRVVLNLFKGTSIHSIGLFLDKRVPQSWTLSCWRQFQGRLEQHRKHFFLTGSGQSEGCLLISPGRLNCLRTRQRQRTVQFRTAISRRSVDWPALAFASRSIEWRRWFGLAAGGGW